MASFGTLGPNSAAFASYDELTDCTVGFLAGPARTLYELGRSVSVFFTISLTRSIV